MIPQTLFNQNLFIDGITFQGDVPELSLPKVTVKTEGYRAGGMDGEIDMDMARNEVADVVNALVGAGMDLKQAMQYAPVAAKFVVGQGADGTDTARMINALGQNAKIRDPQAMQKALEAIAFQGQAGSFEASDMAKWFPQLLAGMAKLGIDGNDAVAQLGAMLQVQMKTAGSSDEAANNLKNWMEKIGTTDVVKAYEDAGIDYQGSMNTGLQKGMSTLEASFALAQRYVDATDPKKAQAMSQAMKKISEEADPEKARQMMSSLEQALRTGDLFADMQVKAALTAYMQNKQLYQQLKKDSADAPGILDKNLLERRGTSAQKWKETGQSVDDALRSVGDAMRPLTDKLASGLLAISKGVSSLSDKSPMLVTGLLGIGAAIATITAAYSSFKIAKGLMKIGQGALAGSSANSGSDSDGEGAKGKLGLAAAIAGAVVNAYSGNESGGSGADGDEGSGGVIGAGKQILEALKGYQPDDEDADEVSKVFVVNAAEIGGAGGGEQGVRRNRRRRGRPGRRPPRPTPPTPPAPTPRLGAVARLTSIASKLPKPLKALPGEAALEAGLKVLDTYQNAETQTAKAEGYGNAAGTLAGTLAGAAAGAAIGSVVPVIGTAVGGMIGAYLGAQGGGELGGIAGKSLFGGAESAVSAAQPPVTPLLIAPRVGPAVPPLASMAASFGPSGSLVMRNRLAPDEVSKSLQEPNLASSAKTFAAAVQDVSSKRALPKVDQRITVSPRFSIMVQGDAKDPRELVNQMMPEIERRLTETAQQVARRDMTDAPVF
jgi:hypothetical protein